jgi:hypothetical protein
MPVKAAWNTTGYVQLGNSRLPLERFEIITTISDTSVPTWNWNEELRKTRSPIQIEGYIDVGGEIFDLVRASSAFTWSIIKRRILPSKQTRVFYRVRARTWNRRKVVVHAHKRRHRGHAR